MLLNNNSSRPALQETLTTAVTWTYSPLVGTLTANGLYTAPASVTTAQAVSVIATSQADSTKSATATVNLLPPAGSFTPIFVHSGGSAYTDSLGNNWSAGGEHRIFGWLAEADCLRSL